MRLHAQRRGGNSTGLPGGRSTANYERVTKLSCQSAVNTVKTSCQLFVTDDKGDRLVRNGLEEAPVSRQELDESVNGDRS